MNHGSEFKLVNGRFSASDADILIAALYAAKIQYHANLLNSQDVFEEDIKHSEKRIMEIENSLKTIQKIVRVAANEGSKIDIECSIKISIAGK